MPHTLPPNPPWHPVASAILARIDAPVAPPESTEPAAADTLHDAIAAQRDPREMTREELDAWIDEPPLSAPKAPTPRPVRPQIGMRQRLSLLQLAAGIGTLDRLSAMSAPAAMTVLEGCAWDQARDTVGFLTDHVLPASKAIFAGACADHRVLRPDASRPPLSAADADRFAETIRAALIHPEPIVLVLPSGVGLDPAFVACAPLRIKIAPVSADILCAYWRATGPDFAPEQFAEATSCLPPDGHLADLPEAVILNALRVGDPVAAASRLSGACAQAPGGPRLSELSPSPAVEAARGLIDGVHAWQSSAAR